MNVKRGNELILAVLKSGNTLRFRALGSSMMPFIRCGSLLTVKPICANAAKIGDVLFAQNETGFIVHRLIKKANIDGRDIFITKGDNCITPDQPFDTEQILGKVIAKKYGKREFSLDSAFAHHLGHTIARIPSRVLCPLFRFSFKVLNPFIHAYRKIAAHKLNKANTDSSLN